ncbi:MAG: NAD(P)H-dependent oxidoreductase, partial [Gemmatimonadaceae bacterium]
DGDYVVCPWHNWKYHRTNGVGEPGYEADAAPAYKTRVENGELYVDLASATKRTRGQHEPFPLARRIERAQLDRVYEAIVHWADVVLVATPIRWGSAGSLYFRMAERLNCVQNQITIANRVLIRNKVAAFIITGGQDNVQGVAGQMLMFFSELGFHFPQFPFIAHSRGWSAEDMERNVDYVMKSEELREGARMLVARAVDTAHVLLDHEEAPHTIARGGRKAHQLAVATT